MALGIKGGAGDDAALKSCSCDVDHSACSRSAGLRICDVRKGDRSTDPETECGRGRPSDDLPVGHDRFVAEWDGTLVAEYDRDDPVPGTLSLLLQQRFPANKVLAPVHGKLESGFKRRDIGIEFVPLGEKPLLDPHGRLGEHSGRGGTAGPHGVVDRLRGLRTAGEFPTGLADIGKPDGPDRVSGELRLG